MNRLPSKAAIAEKAETEAKEFFFLALYLFIALSALAFLKSAILEAQGVYWAHWGFALIKAVLIAKFILIGRALHIGEGHGSRPLIWQTLHKAFAFTIFVAILTVIEEAIVGAFHGRSFWESISDIGGGTLNQLIATEIIVFLVFLPLFAFGALAEVTEDKALFRTFFVERLKFEVAR
ncbi:MAG: hypothetical protein MUO41_00360 [Methyloceanibacter sp.]|nr:hypothetical protein [Methyloceanibacter sp.]